MIFVAAPAARGRRLLRLLLAVYGACVVVPSVGWSQATAAERPELRIRVTDPAAFDIPDAQISVRPAIGGQVMRARIQNENVANLYPPAPGRYVIAVEADGFSEVVSTIDWQGQSMTVEIPLRLRGLRQQITVTSGSRVEELQEDSPVKVEAVSREAMLHTGYERVSDVLSEIPGVVTRSGSSAGVSSEQIRGIGARQVAVLQDGLPIVGARGIKSGNINLNRQSTARLDRVEVVKGAASALYGSDAIGGVINMISREPTQKIESGVSLSGGSLGMLDGRVDVGTRYKNLSVFLDLEHHRQDAYGLLPNSNFTVGPELRRNDLFFRSRYAISPRLIVGFTANGYHNRERGRNAGETGPVSGLYNDSIQNYAFVTDILPTSRTSVQLRAYSARYDENSKLDSLGAPAPTAFANLNQRYKRLDGTVSHIFGSRNFLQGGYEWVQDNYKGANRVVGDNDGRQITSSDVWLQDAIQITRFAKLDIGGRVSSHSIFGTWAVPKVGLVIRLNDNWTVRGAFGKGFRAPDLGQLYYRFANAASFYQVIGNPNLEPETSRSFSTGIHYRSSRFRAGLSLFRNDVRNLIDSINIGTPRTSDQLFALLTQYGIPTSFNPLLNRQTFIYQNFGRIHTQGFELDAEQMITRQLRVAASYTFLDARDSITDLGLPQRHKHQAYVRTEYVNARWGLRTNVRGVLFSRWLLNPAAGTWAYGYRVWDFYVAKDVAKGSQAFFTIDNFANSRDRKLDSSSPTFDRPEYGRQYRVGLRWRFGVAE